MNDDLRRLIDQWREAANGNDRLALDVPGSAPIFRTQAKIFRLAAMELERVVREREKVGAG